ncbi:MAG: tetratricopeptide repeat protein [Acidipila sp.]|nr:tetratricopeptide repeat protein [Acidipila sp.]
MTRKSILYGLFCCAVLAGGGSRAHAQFPPPPPPPPEEPAPDPFHAQKSVEIGQFYMKKGKYEAAIDRFQLAIRYQPKLALPRRLIAEAYEKQKNKTAAVEWYQKYLEALPHAEDAENVRKRIDTLNKEIETHPVKRKHHSGA